jgi:two-component system OmpR family sensor kinase
LAEVLEPVLLACRELLRRAGMELLYLPCETALPRIQADPDRLKQVFFNLLDNAVRYASAGGRVTVTVSVQAPHVLVQVRDFGPGVPAEQLPHLCEWAYRGGAGGAGSGIGLAVCREIVARHGGTLALANAAGGGLLVSVRLPSAG